MLNIYDYVTDRNLFKTFKVDELLFVEYKCLFEESCIPYWTHNNYFSYILSGEATYLSGDSAYRVRKGDAMFVRKGTYVAHGRSHGDYCSLMIFVPDDFVRNVLDKYPLPRKPARAGASTECGSIYPLEVDTSLDAYFRSLWSYFSLEAAPSPELLTIKFEELLLSILTTEKNRPLAECLRGMQGSGVVSIRHVMETSFMHNMSLEEYARLCARSLSSFKEEFFEIFGTTPGRWLILARLRYARTLLETSDEPVNDVAFKSGFKNTTHFVKVFKEHYGMPPLQYRLREARVPAT